MADHLFINPLCIFVQDTDTPQQLGLTDGCELIAHPPEFLLKISLRNLRNVQEALKGNLDSAANIEQELRNPKYEKWVSIRQDFELPSIKHLVEEMFMSDGRSPAWLSVAAEYLCS